MVCAFAGSLAIMPGKGRFDETDLDFAEEDPSLGLGLGLLGGIGIGAGLAHWHQRRPIYILPGRLCGHARPGCWYGVRRGVYRPKIHLGHKRWPHSFQVPLKANVEDEELLDDILEDAADAMM